MGTSLRPIDELPEPLDPQDVDQAQVIGPAILVRPDGPITVHNLPAKAGPVEFDTVASTGWIKVLNRDPKRKRATLIATGTVADQTASVMFNRASSGTSGAPWPLNVPLVVEHGDELYARAVTTSVVVSRLTEIWAS